MNSPINDYQYRLYYYNSLFTMVILFIICFVSGWSFTQFDYICKDFSSYVMEKMQKMENAKCKKWKMQNVKNRKCKKWKMENGKMEKMQKMEKWKKWKKWK